MNKVMIIDQVIPIIRRIKKACRDLDVFFLEANSEYNAVNTFIENNEEIDLVILDVSMNNFDGFRILSKIRHINRKVKIIILTSLNTRKYFVACLKLGVDDYILKPFNNDFLLSRIALALPSLTGEHPVSEDLELKDYFNKNYSIVLENGHKLFVMLGVFYEVEVETEKSIRLKNNNIVDDQILSGLENEFSNELMFKPYKSQSFIMIMPNIEVKDVDSIKKKIKKYFKDNNLNFIFESKILPHLENELISYNSLLRSLEDKMFNQIKLNLSNIRNIKDFKKN